MSSCSRKARVLIVDDHQVVIGGIKGALAEYAEVEVVGEALNGREAVRKVKTLRPDIVIMDISMPDLNGIDATLQIKKYDPNIGIIIFTMYSDTEYVIDLLRSGISAYILKEDPMTDLILAIRAVREGKTFFRKMAPRILADHQENGRGWEELENLKGGFEGLSLREREVLQLLAEGNSIKDVAAKLELSPKTVESHKYNIMDKLGVSTLPDLVIIAIKKRLIHPL